ncbi:MAG: carboxypeptidase regulatory-like domain-containing protein [Fibrobacterales bacterium]|nr:carboxypeptidase regulatory-like domain-containing protein [Fibrobacterales bacterium]
MKLGKLLLSLAFLPALLDLSGCSEQTTYDKSDESKERGRVSVNVVDASGNLLDSVQVTELQGNKVKISKNGVATFDDLTVGTHRFRFQREGYAAVEGEIEVVLDDHSAQLPELTVARDNAHIVSMHRLGVSATGKVVRQVYGGDFEPAAGVVVDLRPGAVKTSSFGGEFFVRHYFATTDENGVYRFDDLPEWTAYAVSARPTVFDGMEFLSPTVTEEAWLLSETAVAMPRLDMTEREGSALLSFSETIESATQPQVVRFSRPVSFRKESSSSPEAVVCEDYGLNDSFANNIVVNASWNADSTVLSILPASGSWTLGSAYDCEATYSTLAGDDVDMDIYFEIGTTEKSWEIVPLKGLALDSAWSSNGVYSWIGDSCLADTTSTVRLRWDADKNHYAYRIYWRIDAGDVFEYETNNAYGRDSLWTYSGSGYDQFFTYDFYSNGPAEKVTFYVAPCKYTWLPDEPFCAPIDLKKGVVLPACED